MQSWAIAKFFCGGGGREQQIAREREKERIVPKPKMEPMTPPENPSRSPETRHRASPPSPLGREILSGDGGGAS